MKSLPFAGALALSFVVAACGGSETTLQGGQGAQGSNAATPSAATTYSATGNVTVIAGDRVTISHGPVAGLGWPAMTMTFTAPEPAMLRGIGVGDRVTFQFRQNGTDYPLTALAKAN
jgi:Cu(I)/Ag(I) efflux system protein CusF